MENLKYPIGRFEFGKTYTMAETKSQILTISALPSKLFNIVNVLNEAQLETPYRPEGWTVRQTVNHIADSHLNAFIRFKLALTEDNPTIKPYQEQLWAELADGKTAPVDWSLQLLKYVHLRWIMLLNSLDKSDFQRTYTHPESKRVFTLQEVAALYAWHSEHHYEHIHQLCIREGWLS
ncbi:MAG: putative metal-dependent hydrolase [Spirosomataceae bacterium]